MTPIRSPAEMAKAAHAAVDLARGAAGLLTSPEEADLARQLVTDLRDEIAELAKDLDLWAKESHLGRIPPRDAARPGPPR